jgi:hypothetical protein
VKTKRVAPEVFDARASVTPTPTRLVTLAPFTTMCAAVRLPSSRVATAAVALPSSRWIRIQTRATKVADATIQPDSTATYHGLKAASAPATITPNAADVRTRVASEVGTGADRSPGAARLIG